MKCPSGLRSTPGKCVYKKLYREFESLLHRHILQTQTPDFPRESRGFVVSGVWKRGDGVGFAFENSERMVDFMRRCKGKVMVRENDHPDIRRVFEGFQFEAMDIRYSTASQRQGKGEVSGELVIMNWVSEDGDVVLI